ncbi:FkbM family methyltransferase [Leptothoe spongobia]|uniref:FkbM family methyltransferase n=1 Tax=Leptothoe spongobia TAU-MAC 1115 TaxID=1967444 RepID=A0A947GJ37_9CYAN|nr:FkbM family methyltransferase [Leptothoe spongobia]MBT9315658.1 FkbM family methyltransferase [Leptothoe spongobia TAU-MAC 1115]
MLKKEILRKLKRKAILLNYMTFKKVIKIEDNDIKIPTISDLSCTLTEAWMIGLLKHLLRKKQGAFFDVGINLGQTLIKVKGVELKRKYIGFEPNPTCVFYVKKLIEKNQFEDCTIVPVGLFTEDKMLSLECLTDSEFDSSASLIENFRSGQTIYRRILVPCFRFENIRDTVNSDNVGIVKIDVEGAELEVVKSLYQLLKTQQPIVLLEILPVYSTENTMRKERQEELERIFNELNYSFFRVEKDKNTFVGLKKIENIGIHSDLNQCDYVFMPNELVSEIQNIARE